MKDTRWASYECLSWVIMQGRTAASYIVHDF